MKFIFVVVVVVVKYHNLDWRCFQLIIHSFITKNYLILFSFLTCKFKKIILHFIRHTQGRVLAALVDGTVAIFHRKPGMNLYNLKDKRLTTFLAVNQIFHIDYAYFIRN